MNATLIQPPYHQSQSPTGELCEMSRAGDHKCTWDASKPDEVDAARRTFDYLTKEKKYIAYSVQKGGEKNEVIKSFDPQAQAIILVPPIVGG